MSADTLAVLLVIAMAPAATAFPIVYGLTSPWYRSLVGRALMTKAVGLAALIDISIVYEFMGDDYPGRDAVRLTVFSLILAGVWLQFAALMVEKYRARRPRRTDADVERDRASNAESRLESRAARERRGLLRRAGRAKRRLDDKEGQR